jgi:hypothetical protein
MSLSAGPVRARAAGRGLFKWGCFGLRGLKTRQDAAVLASAWGYCEAVGGETE